MKRRLLGLATALVTFTLGAFCVAPMRALTSDQPDIFLADPTPRVDLSDEAVLRANLSQLRALIDRHHAERGALHSLDDLVRAGYLKELPLDPLTGKREWRPEGYGCPSHSQFYFFNITGVRVESEAVSSDGTRYSDW